MSEPLWRNVFGEPVDLDNIDREYALNILMMATTSRAQRGYTSQEFRDDPLIQKLREVILSRRRKRLRDLLRALNYNRRCKAAGYPYRARI